MNGYETTDGRLDVTRFEMALHELEAGTLDPAERDAVMALIARSPAAQRTYLGYFELSAMLRAEAATHEERGNLPKVVRFDSHTKLFRQSLLAAAVLLLLSAFVAALIKVARPEPREFALTAAADTNWSVSGKARDLHDQKTMVREGATLRVASGTLELRFESGATMILQGPAHVSFPKLARPVVRSGWLWVDSGVSGEKFEVHTPDLQIRNIGTRFGVRVPDGGPTEVHLIKGRLEVFSESMPERILKLVPEEFGLAIPPQGDATELELARDPFPGIAELLEAPAGYSTTVRSQSPAAYWRFDEMQNDILQNEVQTGAVGRISQELRIQANGPGFQDGFEGFDPSNRAARLEGPPSASRLSLGSAPPRHDGILFHETFEGGQGPLHQATPHVSHQEASWVAAHRFRANGWISSGMASATLPFHPVNGVVYTLDGSFRNVSSSDGDSPWVALGFASGQSTGVKTGDRFVMGNVTGRSWMLYRGAGSTLENMTHDVGDANPHRWLNWSPSNSGDVDMRIVLDTTQGYGNWTATCYAKHPAKQDYIEVGQKRTLPNESIRSVGVAVSGAHLKARLSNFLLRADASAQDPPAVMRASGPAPLLKSAGTVSCWIRRDPGNTGRSILWSAGQDASDNFINLRLEPDGRIGLFIENDRYDMWMTSEEKLGDDRWHHLAASWSPNSADLYLDGRRIAWDRESRDLLQGTLPELQVGSGIDDRETASFTGEIDEFAVWDRDLKPAEIEQQYRSGKMGAAKQTR